MKTLSNYLYGKEAVDEAMNVKNIDDMTEGDFDEKIQQLQDDVYNELRKLNLGDFEVSPAYGYIYLTINQDDRLGWEISYDDKRKNIEFGPVPSLGDFRDGDDVFKFHKSIGIVLQQRMKLNKLILPMLEELHYWNTERLKR